MEIDELDQLEQELNNLGKADEKTTIDSGASKPDENLAKEAPEVVEKKTQKQSAERRKPVKASVEMPDPQDDLKIGADLDAEICAQPSLYAYYSEQCARAEREHERTKLNRDIIHAKLDKDIRARFTLDKKKITENAIEAEILLTSSYRKAMDDVADAKLKLGLMKGLVESFGQREQMLIQRCKRAEVELLSAGSVKSRKAELMARGKS